MEINKNYEPQSIEKKWYKYWIENKMFSPEIDETKRPYTILIPPPNVTNILHMGHVLNNTLQDVMIRYKRMTGIPVLWLPGTDHAGIATQNMVEKELAKQGKTRHEVGREKLIEMIWAWKEEKGGRIIQQLKQLGCSCDWDRQRFTMDEGLSDAVKEVFVRLYEKGLIYKGKRIINWCPRCVTALSNDEVEHEDENGHLWDLKYPLKDGSGYITVATTRPETMLGDTAIAVHPEDDRYKDIVGKTVILPFIEREIPVIVDEYVDKEFGSGCVKITPAHDPNDYEIGLRHDLEQVIVIDEHGIMNENAGPEFQGLDRFTARKKIVAGLKEKGIGLWKKKLDWIAECGGMALLITHPDYMFFDGRQTFDTYPVEHYAAFLDYVRQRYEGQYWHVLPRDLARFWRERYGPDAGDGASSGLAASSVQESMAEAAY